MNERIGVPPDIERRTSPNEIDVCHTLYGLCLSRARSYIPHVKGKCLYIFIHVYTYRAVSVACRRCDQFNNCHCAVAVAAAAAAAATAGKNAVVIAVACLRHRLVVGVALCKFYSWLRT